MKVVELIKFSGEMLKRLHDFGIKIDDYRYLQMYEDLQKMAEAGEKTTYAVAEICRKYHVGERTVYKVKKRFDKDCTDGAAG